MEDRVTSAALQVLSEYKVGVFIVAYNAERHIGSVLERIPECILPKIEEIYVIDDHSNDQTIKSARAVKLPHSSAPLHLYRTPENQGYGGNQILGYDYAIQRGLDIVVLLHGDGQYAPELLPDILAPYADGADAVYGSRFLDRNPLKSKMPLYKYVGNRVLTHFQNWLAGGSLSEWHSGYRSYRIDLLKRIPFRKNNKGFGFDADIIVQILAAKAKLVEVSIPTYYGDEICYVNGLQYAWHCLKTVLRYRCMQVELFYDPCFDLKDPDDDYEYFAKESPTSVHGYVRQRDWGNAKEILDVGGGDGRAVSCWLADQGHSVTSIDAWIGSEQNREGRITYHQVDLNQAWPVPQATAEVVLALDVIEHMLSPEASLEKIHAAATQNAIVCASTANIAFLPLRLMLLFGFFNYGRKGILDRTHTRLFTRHSFRKLFEDAGFVVMEQTAFGPPIADLVGNHLFFRCLDKLAYRLARRLPGLFGYQIMLIAKRPPALEELSRLTFEPRSSDT